MKITFSKGEIEKVFSNSCMHLIDAMHYHDIVSFRNYRDWFLKCVGSYCGKKLQMECGKLLDHAFNRPLSYKYLPQLKHSISLCARMTKDGMKRDDPKSVEQKFTFNRKPASTYFETERHRAHVHTRILNDALSDYINNLGGTMDMSGYDKDIEADIENAQRMLKVLNSQTPANRFGYSIFDPDYM